MLETKTQHKVQLMTYDGQKGLFEVITALGHDPKLISTADLQEVAERLCQVAKPSRSTKRGSQGAEAAGDKPPEWGWRYLRNVLNGKLDASQRMLDAIMRLGASIDGAPVEAVKGERVMVLAVGQVEAGAVVLGSSRRCEYPGCKVVFVPVVPGQKWHCKECRKKSYQLSALSRQPDKKRKESAK